MKKQRSADEAKFYADREMWIEQMFEAPEIFHAEFKVLWFIAKRSSYENGGSYWTVKMISKRCRCSTKTVSEATTKADRLGFLKIARTLGKENFYSLKFFWLNDT